ncbi:DUF6461 domain-containing protein [Nonomuraea sp. NPDC050663]|uniref:DUF6461 domain-containing protein n=1 Tax=Nonomuraea sp. NPDC050663 TaxID=3364370 RepID=UPI0037A72A4A
METEDTGQRFSSTIIDCDQGAIMLELAGLAGWRKDLAEAFSQGTRIAVVTDPFVGSPAFAYVEDGKLLCEFQIRDPYNRLGASPDALMAEMEEAGMLDGEEYYDEDEDADLSVSAETPNLPVLQAIAVASKKIGVPFSREGLLQARHFVSLDETHDIEAAATERPGTVIQLL